MNSRYDRMTYRRCGRSGLRLPAVSLGLWHNFGSVDPFDAGRAVVLRAFALGVTHFDLANNYGPEQTREAARILRELRTPLVLHQPKYSMFVRAPEEGLLDVLREEGVGCIVFSPLAQGLLTNRYLREVPPDSRAAKPHGALREDQITPERRAQLVALNRIAAARGQSLAQLALAWVLRHEVVTSALVGASRVSQLEDNVAALDNLSLSDDELREIDRVLESSA